MRHLALFAAAAMSLLLMGGCAVSPLTEALHAASAATVSRHDVNVLLTATNGLEDTATAVIDGCIAASSRSGICAPAVIDKVHGALVAMRTPRDQLNAFAQTHGDQQLGVVGLYDAVGAAKTSLTAILKQYGAAV